MLENNNLRKLKFYILYIYFSFLLTSLNFNQLITNIFWKNNLLLIS